MSLVKWEEAKPCALARPKFVKIRLRDARGVPTGETYTKRVGRATCASGLPATSSVSVDGKVYHLCADCGKADLLDYLGDASWPLAQQEHAAPMVAREGELVLVRVGRDTMALAAKLRAAGYAAKARTRTVKRAGCLTDKVSVWERA